MDNKNTYPRRKYLYSKTLGISKIFYLPLIITVPNSILEIFKKFRKQFYSTLLRLKSIRRQLVIHFKMEV